MKTTTLVLSSDTPHNFQVEKLRRQGIPFIATYRPKEFPTVCAIFTGRKVCEAWEERSSANFHNDIRVTIRSSDEALARLIIS